MLELNILQKIVLLAVPILFAITIHEVSHGWVANRLGDPTAKMLGRLTLNPIKHIDPIGTILVPGLLILASSMMAGGGGFIFGWAKPVPITWSNLKHPRRDIALVAVAGPISNLLMALFWGAVMKLGVVLAQGAQVPWSLHIIYMAQAGIMINFVLLVLNLIPIPPLDGSRVVSSFLSPRASYQYNRLEAYGFLIILGLLVFGVLQKIILPAVIFLYQLVLMLFGFV